MQIQFATALTLPLLLALQPACVVKQEEPKAKAHKAKLTSPAHKQPHRGGPELAPPDKAPKVVFASREHDLGEVREGENVSHVFKLRNEGVAPLIIGRLHAT